MARKRGVSRKVPAYLKRGSVDAPTLFPGLSDDVVTGDAPSEKAAAFISRWSQCSDIYRDTLERYQAGTGDVQAYMEKIKYLYEYYLFDVDAPWDEEKFFTVCVWCMDNGRPLTRGTFMFASRLYDAGRLPVGSIDGFNADDYEYIIGVRRTR